MHQLIKTGAARAALGSLLLALVAVTALVWASGLGISAPAPSGGVTGSYAAPPGQLFPTPHPPAAATSVTADTPTPEGTVNATPVVTDPFQVLDVFNLPQGERLVKKSILDLGGGDPKEVLLTISSQQTQTNTVGVVETTTVSSLAVLRYDPAGSEWKTQWQSTPVPGMASVLPDTIGETNRIYQGGDLLRTGQPILLLRTYEPATKTIPGAEHLHLWAWTGDTAVPVRMIAAGEASERDADFSGTSDVQTADLDDDGVIEIIADSGAHTDIYRWDKTHFVVQP
jgi:hypothetical protein